jgi:hypothetical protein
MSAVHLHVDALLFLGSAKKDWHWMYVLFRSRLKHFFQTLLGLELEAGPTGISGVGTLMWHTRP